MKAITKRGPNSVKGSIVTGLVPKLFSLSLMTGTMVMLSTPVTSYAAQSSGSSQVYTMYTASSNDVLAGWPASNAIDGNASTAYSSQYSPTAANNADAYLAAWLSNGPQTVNTVNLQARMVGSTIEAFPAGYTIFLTNSSNSAWVQIGYYTTQPNANGQVSISLGSSYSTYGVLIVPQILGADSYGNHYFQLAEVNLANESSSSPGSTGSSGTQQTLPLGGAQSNDVLSGWPASNAVDGNPSTSYSSQQSASSANSAGAYLAAWLASGPQTVNSVLLQARMVNGQAQAFPESYTIYLTNSNDTAWIDIGTYTTQPNSSGEVTVSLGQSYSTYGVLIAPQTLGTDSYGNYYFQLAELGLADITSSPAPSPTPTSTSSPLPVPTSLVASSSSQQAFALMDATSNDVLSGWPASNATDGNPNTAYSSGYFTSATNDRGTYLAAWLSNSPQSVNQVIMTARAGDQGFPVNYQIYLTNSSNSAWDLVGTFTNQPDMYGNTVIQLPSLYVTYGVLIIPQTLGTDSYGNHFFQLAELNLGFGLETSTISRDNTSSSAGSVTSPAGSVVMYHNDLARTGQNLNETILTRANVNTGTFGKIAALPVDGEVYAQPLALPSVNVAGTTRSLVFVATENDSVFAFDTQSLSTTPVWQRSFLGDADYACPNSPCTALGVADTGAPNITPEIGITATPVIDPVNGILYVTAVTKENGSIYWRLHALSVSSGQEMPGSPVLIDAAVPGSGSGAGGDGLVHFQAKYQLQRAGLVLSNGVLYIAFTSYNDIEPTHGWLFAYNASTLALESAFNTTPNSGDGTIWQAGGAPAVDDSGNLYFATGNGDPNYAAEQADYSDSIVKVALGTQGIQLEDFFTPYNWEALAFGDVDVGSGGVLLLPDQPGAHPHLVMGGGKQGTIYLLDRDNMGKLNSAAGATADTQIVQEIVGEIPGGKNYGNGIYGTASYYNGQVFMVASGDYLRSIPLSNGLLNWNGMSQSSVKLALRGATASISANGSSNGIVWYIDASAYTYSWNSGSPNVTTLTNGPSILYAFSTDNLSQPLYSSATNSADAAGDAVKFTVPTVAGGKVFVGTDTEISVYGLK